MPVLTRSMRARPVPPMPVHEQEMPEDPMSIDIPAEATPDDPMPVDEPIFPERPVPDWAQKFMAYLVGGILPTQEVEARQIVRRAKSFTIINKELYKRSVTGIYQRCDDPEQGRALLLDIHQGECGHHVCSRALVAKAFRHGFYWPTSLSMAEDIVRKCRGCQLFSKQIHLPASALKTIPITWPFAVWCLDMVGPFKPARGNLTHILVMVDKLDRKSVV